MGQLTGPMHNVGLWRTYAALLLCIAIPRLLLAGETAYSDIKDDETVQFFRTSAWLDEDDGIWHVPIHGWIYEPEDSDIRKAAAQAVLEQEFDLAVTGRNQANFERRLNLLIADNERGKRIVVRIAGRDYPLPPSGVNGHIRTVLQLPAMTVQQHAGDGYLAYKAVTRKGDKRRFPGEAVLVGPRGTSVISDIDDTVKITAVTDRRKMLEHTFLLDFAAAPGMACLYSDWAGQDFNFHFVSSSPWQLSQPLSEFLDNSGFPRSDFNLKSVRFRDETLFNLFKEGTETKPAIIESILNTWPGRRFILVGDSGEQDPEVYASIMRKHPDRIVHAYIRNVTGESQDSSRLAAVFEGIDVHRWTLFDDPGPLPRSSTIKVVPASR